MGDDKNSIQEFSYEPDFTRTPPQASLAKVHVPHWSATRPRSRHNQQPIRFNCWQSKTGQAGF
jgi:hypothetical protein